MRKLRHAVSFAIVVASAASIAPGASHAATVVYTFEPPNFTAGETTPIADVTPNVGPASFLATFTGNNFQIINFQPNILFSGQTLVQPTGSTGPLAVSFNMPVTEVLLDFAENAASAGGTLVLQSAAGGVTVGATLVGGLFPGGVLDFTSATPFTSFTLTALGPTGAPVEFAIDNLTLTFTTGTVAEPPLAALVASALLLLAVMRRRATM